MKGRFTIIFLSIILIFCSSSNLHAQTVQWAKQGVSEGFENGNGITSDDSGNVYVTGQTEFSAVYDSHILNSWGSHDILVGKYRPNGTISWIRNAGGKAGDVGHGVGVDAVHNTYIIGEMEDTADFSSGIKLNSHGANDIFIAKYNIGGNITWAKGFGSAGNDKGEAITVTPSGDCYMTGYFSSTTDFGGNNLNSVGGYDIFIMKTNSAGVIQWIKKAGGQGNDRGNGIAIDASGNVYVTGTFYQAVTFNNTTTISAPTKTGAFLAKYDSTGQFQWARAAGSCCDTTKSNALALDENGNIYLTGSFKIATTFGSNNFTTDSLPDIFIVKYDPSGNVVWAKQAGGPDDDAAEGICVDKNNKLVYITGQVHQPGNFDTCHYTTRGFMDVFLAAYNYDGNAVWVKIYGGHLRDQGLAVSVDPQGNIISTGLYNDIADFGGITLTGYPAQPWAEFYVDKISPAVAILPSVASSNLTFGYGNCSDINLSFTPGNGQNRIIVMRQGAAVNAFPQNGISYSADLNFGNGSNLGNDNYVVYNGSGNNVTITNLTPGLTYYFSVIEYNGYGIASNFLTNNPANGNAVARVFPITITSNMNTICQGDSIDLQASGALTYSWSPSDYLSNSNSSIVTSFPNSTTDYSVHGITSDGCYAEGLFKLFVNPLPVVSFPTLNAVCKDNPAITLSGGNPAGGIYSGQGVNGNQFMPSNVVSGNIQLNYEYSDVNGCRNIAQSSIQVNSLPNVILNTIPSLCENETPLQLSNGIPSGGSYVGTNIVAGIFNPSIGPGSYSYTYSYTDNNGCSASSSDILVVNPSPSVQLGPDLIVCADNSATLNAGNGLTSYIWSTGETTSSIIVDSSGVGLGVKNIYVIVENTSGCKASDIIQIRFDLCAGINSTISDLDNLSVSPNPFNNNITLQADKNISICLYDICGKAVEIKENVNGKIIIGENLKAGVYFVYVLNGINKKVFTVIKSIQ